MINEAMFVKRDDLNPFTRTLKALCERNPAGVLVQLRNGMLADVAYRPGSDDMPECATFHTPSWSLCWFMDGSSCTSEDFDIVRMGLSIDDELVNE